MKKIFYIPGIIFALAVVVFALLQSLSAVVYGGMDFYRQEFIKHDVAAAVDMEVEDVVMAKLDRVALDPRFRKEA